jgi:FAD/FMN-containing dehydrogenases
MADAKLWADLAATVAAADAVVTVGAGTHAEVGGAVIGATQVSAPSGIVEFEPSDMTVKVNAGTSFAELRAVLAEHGQECPLDPRDQRATIGGIVACGLSGTRRLGLGPVRDNLLEVTFVTADGRVVRGGGPTVKNVTGYDVPRLFVGSLGTLGVLVQVILRTRPLPVASLWFSTDRDPIDVHTALHRASTIAWDGATTRVLLEGHTADIDQQAAQVGLLPTAPPKFPAGPHRGRVSIEPNRLRALSETLRATDTAWLAEIGVGTVHVVTDDPQALAVARAAAELHRGWLLRETGAPDLDPFGIPFPATAVQHRLRQALDPTGKLSPGRVPATAPIAGVAA